MTVFRIRQAGSVLIYVLMAVALLGLLTFMITRQMNDGTISGSVSGSKAKLKGEELITYATAAKSTVEQMTTMSNVLPNEFSFVKQADADYATGTNKGKVYHPAGGGLNEFVPAPEMFAVNTAQRGWVGQVGTNVEWSATSGSDVIFSFLDVNTEVCKAINERLFKDSTIPTTTLDTVKVFVNGGGDDTDFLTADCSACNGRAAMCVKDKDGVNVFYNVLISR